MEFITLILAYLGSVFFYVFLAVNLPEKFSPVKLAYWIISFFFIILMFGSFAIVLVNPDITFTVPQNVTFNNENFTTNVTVTQSPYSSSLIDLITIVVYGNGIIMGITILYIIIILLREAIKPIEDTVNKLDRS